MAKLRITVATWDYDRVRPIMDGRVPIEGCEINYLALEPEECFHRAYINREFEVSEIGFSPYLIARSRGVSPYVAIPVFLSRTFRHSAIYIRNDRGIVRPEDLRGRMVGVPEYQMSAALYARAMLHHQYGVAPMEISWMQGSLETWGRRDKFPLNLPEGFPLTESPKGCSLSSLLDQGKIDAVITAHPPSCFLNGHPHIERMFRDVRTVERAYFAQTGIFPIMHAVGIREDVAAEHRWLAASVMKAFVEAQRICYRSFEETAALKVMLPWVAAEHAETVALMGEDYWAYGVEPNRRTLEAVARYSFEQGLAVRELTPVEMFEPTTVAALKV
jgi:4,5-dihydroxyphthalate decarboxylase